MRNPTFSIKSNNVATLFISQFVLSPLTIILFIYVMYLCIRELLSFYCKNPKKIQSKTFFFFFLMALKMIVPFNALYNNKHSSQAMSNIALLLHYTFFYFINYSSFISKPKTCHFWSNTL